MIVGDARTGKTSVVRSLKKQPFDKNQSITNAVEISEFSAETEQVKMKIFDFGGQEIFQFVHPIFQSSQQCIVILVVNEFYQTVWRIKDQIDFLKNFRLSRGHSCRFHVFHKRADKRKHTAGFSEHRSRT